MAAFRGLLERELLHGGRTCEFYETTGDIEEDVTQIVRDARERGISLVVAAGGDGTVGAVVNGLVGSEIPLGIIPVGTGNILARAMRIPPHVEDAVPLIAGDHDIVAVDAMRIGDQHFVLNISAGISASSIHDTSPQDKRRFGMLAYIWRVVGHIFGFKSYRFDLTLDGYTRTVDATELLISNGTLMEKLPVVLGPRDTFCDGRIYVYVINGRSVLDYLTIILRAVFRFGRKDAKFMHFSVTDHLTVVSHRRSQKIQGDGEVYGTTPVEVRVVPGAVRVIAPHLPV